VYSVQCTMGCTYSLSFRNHYNKRLEILKTFLLTTSISDDVIKIVQGYVPLCEKCCKQWSASCTQCNTEYCWCDNPLKMCSMCYQHCCKSCGNMASDSLCQEKVFLCGTCVVKKYPDANNTDNISTSIPY
jgi:hypothetical protein